MRNKIAAYSFLATINNGNNEIKNLTACFEPLVKSAIASLYKNGMFKYIVVDLQESIMYKFGIEMPVPVIVEIVKKISIESKVTISEDYTIIVKNYTMEGYIEKYEDARNDVKYLEEHFNDYLKLNGIEEELELYDFINLYFDNEISFNESKECSFQNNYEYYHHAKFINSITHDKEKFKILKKIFWGAIVSKFIMQSTQKEPVSKKQIFLIDTSFLVSLIGYHSEISNKICNQVYEIACKNGYKFEIFDQTVQETENLILETAKKLKAMNKISDIFSNDITKGCFNNPKITPTDMERTAGNLKNILKKLDIRIMQIEKMRIKVMNEGLYNYYINEIHKDPISAFHDAAAIYYVKKCRGKETKNFEDAKCWFIQDRKNRSNGLKDSKGYLNERVSSHDVLMVLWMTNPENILNQDIGEIELIKALTMALEGFIPSRAVLKEFEDNLEKYMVDEISNEDYARLAQTVATKTIYDLESLNSKDKEDFSENVFELIRESKREELETKASYESEISKVEAERELLKGLFYEETSNKNKEIEEKEKAKREIQILKQKSYESNKSSIDALKIIKEDYEHKIDTNKNSLKKLGRIISFIQKSMVVILAIWYLYNSFYVDNLANIQRYIGTIPIFYLLFSIFLGCKDKELSFLNLEMYITDRYEEYLEKKNNFPISKVEDINGKIYMLEEKQKEISELVDSHSIKSN